MEKTTLRVSGMTCGNCVKHVTKALTRLGVPPPDVDLATGKVELNYDPSAVSLEAIREAIGAAGYSVS